MELSSNVPTESTLITPPNVLPPVTEVNVVLEIDIYIV